PQPRGPGHAAAGGRPSYPGTGGTDPARTSGGGRRVVGGLSPAQHSMTLMASPPREVSLYLVFMSAPVSRMVLMTRSSETLCEPSPRRAMREALIAFTDPMALRSMQGIWTSPPTGSQVR